LTLLLATACGGKTSDDTDTDTDLSDDCLFGDTSSELRASTLVDITDVGTYGSASEIPETTAQQFMTGMEAEGYAEFDTLGEAFAYTDDGVYAFNVVAKHDAASYAWLKWWAGDTEVGYLFDGETVSIVAVVSDGDIQDCTVMAPK